MDNLNSTGISNSDEVFGYIPPNLMFDIGDYNNEKFLSKEEKERYYYNREHQGEKDYLY